MDAVFLDFSKAFDKVDHNNFFRNSLTFSSSKKNLDDLQVWESSWKIETFNPLKCEHVKFTRKELKEPTTTTHP